eukprot:6201704-Pleurochrysis_carterae.AAC.4
MHTDSRHHQNKQCAGSHLIPRSIPSNHCSLSFKHFLSWYPLGTSRPRKTGLGQPHSGLKIRGIKTLGVKMALAT